MASFDYRDLQIFASSTQVFWFNPSAITSGPPFLEIALPSVTGGTKTMVLSQTNANFTVDQDFAQAIRCFGLTTTAPNAASPALSAKAVASQSANVFESFDASSNQAFTLNKDGNIDASYLNVADFVDPTKQLRWDVSAIPTASSRFFTWLGYSGSVVVVGDDPPSVGSGNLGKVNLTAQSAAIGATNLTNGPTAGMYLVQYAIADTTADVTAGTIQFQINYTDVVGATTQTGAALALTATGRDRGEFVVQLSSGEISYQTNLVGIIGAARYAVYVRVVALG